MTAANFRGDVVRPEAWCLVADATSVEARFGVRRCQPTESGNCCAYTVPDWARDTHGHLRSGALMVLADHILGELPYKARGPSSWSLTTELTLDIIGDTAHASELHARATQIPSAADKGFVQCVVTDTDERVVAVGNTRTVYVPAAAGAVAIGVAPSIGRRDPGDTLESVLGVISTETNHGVELTMRDPGAWVNDFGILHGGVAACLSEMAASQLFSRHGRALTVSRMHCTYLRPATPTTPFVVSARAHHVGKGFAVAEVVGRAGDGPPCTVMTVTARRTVPTAH